MKKILLSLNIFVSVFASDKIISKEEILNLLKVTPIYNRIAPQLGKGIKIKGKENKDFYILTIITPQGSANLYISHNKRYTILGRLIKNSINRKGKK